MKSILVLFVVYLLAALLGSIKFKKYFYNILLISIVSLMVYSMSYLISFNLIDYCYISSIQASKMLFFSGLIISGIFRTLYVAKNKHYNSNVNIKLEKWNFLSLIMFFIFVILILIVFLQTELPLLTLIIVEIFTSAMVFLFWLVIEEKNIIIYPIIMAIINIILFSFTLFI